MADQKPKVQIISRSANKRRAMVVIHTKDFNGKIFSETKHLRLVPDKNYYTDKDGLKYTL